MHESLLPVQALGLKSLGFFVCVCVFGAECMRAPRILPNESWCTAVCYDSLLLSV